MTYSKFWIVLSRAQEAWRLVELRRPRAPAEYAEMYRDREDAFMRVIRENFVEAGWTPPGDARGGDR